MNTQLIKLEDETLVEVEVSESHAEQISGSGVVNKVDSTFDKIKPILVKTCKPINEVWKELQKEVEIEKAEIELGLSFEGEGNIFITKSKAKANLTVKLVLKPSIK